MLAGDLERPNIEDFRAPPSTMKELPDAVDWRLSGAVGDVRDQGYCGSCWAFSAVETVASARAIQSGNPVEVLSPQQLVDW